ncbi:hypothetical protein [Oribacterium sp. FC2011]|uniref:hypothetical protein n=1 Tax=Oribacterium sp. FC2011 TaxID=1408311 RepID=UPI0004E2617F|nr:hypothetical protein [Oribacterium sp. FC2011]
MKLRDFEYNPLGIINKYPFYPELMGKHIKTKPNEKGEKLITDYIEERTPRIFDGYDQIKVRPAKGSLRSIKKRHDFVDRKALLGTVTVIDRKGFEQANLHHEERLIRAMFRHLTLNVFHIPIEKENIHYLDKLPFNVVKDYVARYFPSNPLWLVSTVSASNDFKHHDIERTPELSVATSIFSSIRRQYNLIDTVTNKPVRLKPGVCTAPHRDDEPDELYQVYCFEGKGYQTDDDKKNAFKPIPILKSGYRSTKEDFDKSLRTDDMTSFLDPNRNEIRIGFQSMM